MITDVIQKLVDRSDLREEEAGAVMEEIMSGGATDAQIGAFLAALRMKGETPGELVGFARVLRRRAAPLWDGEPLDVLDTAGTGGDGSGTFNISTAAAFVAAGAGASVAKHGNRAASSRCGSADVMEALGVEIQMPVEKLRQALKEIGIGFLFAPAFHSSMKHVAPARSQLRMRTVFNIVGPLANPASARSQVIGVYSESLLERMALAVGGLGARHAFVVHGAGGLDEASLSGPTEVVEVLEGAMRRFAVRPEDFGLDPAPPSALKGGDAAVNAQIVLEVLEGVRGPRRDAVLLNAAFAITAAGRAETLEEGIRTGAEAIDSGRAKQKLDALRAFSSP